MWGADWNRHFHGPRSGWFMYQMPQYPSALTTCPAMVSCLQLVAFSVVGNLHRRPLPEGRLPHGHSDLQRIVRLGDGEQGWCPVPDNFQEVVQVVLPTELLPRIDEPGRPPFRVALGQPRISASLSHCSTDRLSGLARGSTPAITSAERPSAPFFFRRPGA